MKAGVLGASGYTGAELLRLLAGHPDMELAVAQAESSAGARLAEIYPGLGGAYGDLVLDPVDPHGAEGLDVVFLCLPAGHAQHVVPGLIGTVPHIVDLSADFRLKDAAAYPVWYGFEHVAPDLLDSAVYGLPELFREALSDAELIAAPGCYVTAASLALEPLVRGGAVEPDGVIVDAASGVSGAGRSPKAHLHYPVVNESFAAYGLLDHRHTPEMEQVIGARVLFTPHLAPMTRGILATCYTRPAGGTTPTTAGLIEQLREAYRGERFVRVVEEPPSTADTYGSNMCHLTARVDERTGWIIVLSAIDNLVKGASGQALQAANLALGLPEATGLATAAMAP